MNSHDTLKKLFSLTHRGIHYELERMQLAAARAGNPQNAFSSIHVAGTNGKGSTCTYCAAMLQAAGYSTGLYTSPHLVNFEERFVVNNSIVPTGEWLDIYQQFEPIIDDLHLTFFEATTLIAFELFKRKKVDWAVLEVGMGGRLDATNIVIPAASVITAIGMDHVEYLGETIEEIASEKLGIVKQGVPSIIQQPSNDLESFMRNLCLERGASSCEFAGLNDVDSVESQNGKTTFMYKKNQFAIKLAGQHQIVNAVTAIKAIESLGGEFKDLQMLSRGISSASIPGRFEIFEHSGKKIIFDVAHNPQAIGVLIKTLRDTSLDTSLCCITGVMKDKDTGGVVSQLTEISHHLILTQPKIDRAEEALVLFEKVPEQHRGKCEVMPTVREAIQKALQLKYDVICVTGSFYTVGEAMTAVGYEPFFA